MNINMIDASEKSQMFSEKTKYSNPSSGNARIAESMAGYSLDITGKVMENAAYDKDDLKSIEDISMEAGLIDVPLNRNYMAIMSNSMSEDDFSDLLKEGANPTHTTIEESVTSLDRLKATMAENGQIIEGFNDDLSSEDIKEALNIGAAIMPLKDDDISYMLKNELEPTIENLYMSEYKSSSKPFNDYRESAIAWDEISKEAASIIEAASMEVNEENLENARFLVEEDIPLNEKNLKAIKDLKSLKLPVSIDRLKEVISYARLEGKPAKAANLFDKESLYEKAVRIKNDFALAEDGGDITRRRQLEEVRLAMSVEANLTLLRKGISIDTKNLEQLVENLKKAEEEFYKPLLLSDDGDLREKIDLYKETNSALDIVRTIPSRAVADVIEAKNDFNLDNLAAVGTILKSEYEKAGQSYESLMTAPRADMGDSIAKAFRNVDDILNDLELPLSDENRKAVRILGYSSIQITRENLENIRVAANTVSNVLEMMTPSRTLQMIREGHNPLTENLYELEKALKDQDSANETEKYSEFLLKLERRGEITEDEKSAFIGMYRLFDKIERKDSRVIGKVLSLGQELNFKNLLSAYRSGRFGHVDISVDEEFGFLEGLNKNGESITDQIEKAFTEIQKEDTPKEYINDKLSMVDRAFKETETVKLLEDLEIPVTIENILAGSDFVKKGRQCFKKLDENGKDTKEEADAKELIKKLAVKIVDDFVEGNISGSYEEFTQNALKTSEEMIKDASSYDNLQEWARLNRQIYIAGSKSRFNEYEVPVETEDGTLRISLKIVDSDVESGKVEASFEDEIFGEIRAAFTVKDDKVNALVSARYEGGYEKLKNKEKELKEALTNAGFETENVTYVKANSFRQSVISKGSSTNTRLFKVAGIFLKTMRKVTD